MAKLAYDPDQYLSLWGVSHVSTFGVPFGAEYINEGNTFTSTNQWSRIAT